MAKDTSECKMKDNININDTKPFMMGNFGIMSNKFGFFLDFMSTIPQYNPILEKIEFVTNHRVVSLSLFQMKDLMKGMEKEIASFEKKFGKDKPEYCR